jgi:hypothetical protein
MLKRIVLAAAVVMALAPACQSLAVERLLATRSDRAARAMARSRSWHGDYYHTTTGYPIPLVVPPTANMETRYGWGVSQSTMTPIYHQYQRPYPGFGRGAFGQFRPTPMWPSHTDQFGTYYVRGPW